MFRSARGSAASDEAVVNASSHGSLVAAQNRRSGTLPRERDGQEDQRREREQRPVEREHQAPSRAEHAEPVPAHRHRDRPRRRRPARSASPSPTSRNITSLRLSQTDSMTALAGPGTCDSAIANTMANTMICSDSFPAAASKTLRGTLCSSTAANVGAGPRRRDRGARGPGVQPDADARPHEVHRQQAHDERERGDDLEVQQGSDGEPARSARDRRRGPRSPPPASRTAAGRWSWRPSGGTATREPGGRSRGIARRAPRPERPGRAPRRRAWR